MRQYERAREIWRIGGSFDNLAVVRRADLRAHEPAVTITANLMAQIERWLGDPMAQRAVLDLYGSINGGLPTQSRSLSVAELRRQVMPKLENAFRRGELVLLKGPRPFGSSSVSASALIEQLGLKRDSEDPPPRKATKHWIGFEVIDEDTGEPIEGVNLNVRLPDGTVKPFLTNFDGRIDVRNLDDGVCDVSCDLEAAELKNTYKFLGIF